VHPDLFADGQEDLLFGPPEIIYGDERKSATFKVPVVQLDPGSQIAGRTITLTLVDGEFAMEKQVKLAQQSRTE
jgi:suppressor for copper-sensitivity B